MEGQGDPLVRVADALERLVPPTPHKIDWTSHPAYFMHGGRMHCVAQIDALPLDRLKGIDRQKQAVSDNLARHAAGAAAHDLLLWGARGMGKSALLRAAVVGEQEKQAGSLALIQVDTTGLATLPDLFEAIAAVDRRFILYLDDLAFDRDDDTSLRHLRSALEGSVAPRPANVRLAVTSNHRAIVARDDNDQPGPLHERDRTDDSLALADRFGLSLGFHACDQNTYLAIVAAHAEPLGLDWAADEALEWSRARGALSGRSAWQFVTEIAGRAGVAL